MRYRISHRADADIDEICDYIAQHNIRAADKVDLAIHQAVERLSEMPGLGHTRADVSDPRYRFWSVGNYVIAYRVEERTLVVVRVLHGARDFRAIFGKRSD